MQKGSVRKVRADKKREIKPTVPIQLKDIIYRISYVIDTPVKDIVEEICVRGLESRHIITKLSSNFKRNARFQNTVFIGHLENRSLQRMEKGIITGRVTSRFKQPNYENLVTLAFALDVTPTRAASLLLEATIKNGDIMNGYLQKHLSKKLDYNRMAELRKIIHYINDHSNREEKVSWLALLSYIYSELKSNAASFADTINDFIDKWR